MRALLALLFVALLATGPAWADTTPAAPVRTVAGKRPVAGDVPITAADVGALSCIGTCASWPTFLQQLAILIPTASDVDVRTSISDAPNGADYVELQSGTIHSSSAAGSLSMFIQNRYGFSSAQMIAVFQAAGATTSSLAPYALPTLAQLGAAAMDLSNVSVPVAKLNLANAWQAMQTFGSSVRLPNGQSVFWVDTYGGVASLILQGDNNLVFYGISAAGSPYPVFSQKQHVNNAPFQWSVPIQLLAAGSTGDASTFTSLASGTPTPLALNDLASRGLPVTPQMFGAVCNSNGTAGNGTDDTTAIQAAVNFAETSGGTVKFPGRPLTGGGAIQACRSTAPIVLNARVAIDGDGCQPYTSNGAPIITPGAGSWLFFDHAGKGIQSLDLGPTPEPSGIVIRNVCTIRPQPAYVASGPWSPNTAIDYDLDLEKDDSTVENVLLLNPTRGIVTSARVNIFNVRMDPYLVGISMSNDQDVTRLDQIHIWPFAGINTPAANYKLANLQALVMGRTDNPQISNFFAIGANICIHLIQNSSGIPNKIHASNIDCDLYGNTGLLSEANGATGQFTNFTLQGGGSGSSTTTYSAVDINATNNHMSFGGFRSTVTGGAAVFATGVGNWLDFSGVFVENWGINGTSATAAFDAENGATINLDANPLFGPGSVTSTLYSGGSSGTINRSSFSKVN